MTPARLQLPSTVLQIWRQPSDCPWYALGLPFISKAPASGACSSKLARARTLACELSKFSTIQLGPIGSYRLTDAKNPVIRGRGLQGYLSPFLKESQHDHTLTASEHTTVCFCGGKDADGDAYCGLRTFLAPTTLTQSAHAVMNICRFVRR